MGGYQPLGTVLSLTDTEFLNLQCRENLDIFTQKSFTLIEPTTPFEYNWHITCIAEHLQAVWDGEISKLIINMPPRSLKTHTTSVSFAAWLLGKDPTIQLMLTSFKAALAEQMTRRTRTVMQSEWYKQCFPLTRLSDELNRQYYFETTRKGQYFSSAMANVTGVGCSIQICDDPLSPDEALSDQVRNSVIETIRGTLFSRFNDPRKAKFVLNMQRLHDDDPTGNLLKEDGWYHLKLPAEAKAKSYSYSARGKTWGLAEGQLLFPSRFTPDVLSNARALLGEYAYAGQYLQEPVPIGGGLIKLEWVQYYAQGSIKPKTMNLVILIDPAGGDDDEKKKKDKSSDWTAMMVVGLAPDNNYYLLDIIRDRLNPTERIDILFALHRKWNALTGRAPKVGYEKYSMQSDTHYITKKQSLDAYHFPLITVAGPKSKTSRVSRLVPDMQNGRWYFPSGLVYIDGENRKWDLIQELLNVEIRTFPMSKYDDMLDALSRVYEPELCVAFPKPKIGTVAKARQQAYNSVASDSWESW
jgi:predicted phage terminase large subunit-like protein